MFGMIPNSKPPGWDHGSFMKITLSWRILPHWSFSLEVVTYALQWPYDEPVRTYIRYARGMSLFLHPQVSFCTCSTSLSLALNAREDQFRKSCKHPRSARFLADPAAALSVICCRLKCLRCGLYIWGMSDFFGGHCWPSLAMNSYNKRSLRENRILDDILVLEWSFFGMEDGSQTKTVTGFLCTPKRIMFQRFFLLKRIAGRATHIRICMGNQVQFFAIHHFCGCCLPILNPWHTLELDVIP